MRPNFFHHLHPPTIPADQARWRFTLGAGGTAIFLVAILTITGMLEMFFYIPTPEKAALSVQTITYLIPFGGLVRNLHFWSAQGLLIVSAIHLTRVVFTAAYSSPRKFNYLLGLGLFVLIILLDFTGYILRWDEGIHWALVVGTNLLKTIPIIGGGIYQFVVGADQPGEATLLRFYAWHIVGLMVPALIMVGWHAFKVRRDGGIATPAPRSLSSDPMEQVKPSSKITRFELVNKEVIVMLLTLSAFIALSLLVSAPIGSKMDAAQLSTGLGSTTAPWFFLWVQQMLKWGDPFIWGIFVPLLLIAYLVLLPYIFPAPDPTEIGRWFPRSNRFARVIFTLVIATILILTIIANVK